jgi:GT2 family glycosyltransferase
MNLSVPVAICIPTRNQSGLITDALRSAFGQTIAPRDVVVSDDAGTDDTEAVVEAFRATLMAEAELHVKEGLIQVALSVEFISEVEELWYVAIAE